MLIEDGVDTFSADAWLFEDVHTLRYGRIDETDVTYGLLNFGTEGHLFEMGIQPMQGVAYLIQRPIFVH